MSFVRFAALLAVMISVVPDRAYSQATVEVGSDGVAIALAFHDVASNSTSSAGTPAVTRIHEGDTIQFNWVGSFHNITPYDTTDRNANANVSVSSSTIMASSTWTPGTRRSTYQCTRHSGSMTGEVHVFEVARQFRVTANPTTVVAGRQFTITVTAIGQGTTTDELYRGTIRFATTDTNPAVRLPLNYTFVDADRGTHTFNGVILGTPIADRVITVSEVGGTGLTGQINVRVISPSAPNAPSNVIVR